MSEVWNCHNYKRELSAGEPCFLVMSTEIAADGSPIPPVAAPDDDKFAMLAYCSDECILEKWTERTGKLKPCRRRSHERKCTGKLVMVRGEAPGMFWIRCQTCRAVGCCSKTKKEAIEAWNGRQELAQLAAKDREIKELKEEIRR